MVVNGTHINTIPQINGVECNDNVDDFDGGGGGGDFNDRHQF